MRTKDWQTPSFRRPEREGGDWQTPSFRLPAREGNERCARRSLSQPTCRKECATSITQASASRRGMGVWNHSRPRFRPDFGRELAGVENNYLRPRFRPPWSVA
jgi:hypothetical protein